MTWGHTQTCTSALCVSCRAAERLYGGEFSGHHGVILNWCNDCLLTYFDINTAFYHDVQVVSDAMCSDRHMHVNTWGSPSATCTHAHSTTTAMTLQFVLLTRASAEQVFNWRGGELRARR